ncbi:MAG: HAD family phosphatase [Endomicrobia bacterium]|nr:HAD family phosphatase [Endomicrobiia bacterium]
MKKKLNIKNFKALLFDMDGIVVDSMPYHFISWFEVLKHYGVRVSPMTIFEMEGAKWDEVIKTAYKQSGKKFTPGIAAKIRFERETIFKKYFNRYIFDGIPEFLREQSSPKQGFKQSLKQSFMTGLVTGSSLKEAEGFLPADLYNLFDVVVAGDMVKRSKPYPDPYLAAAKKLGVLPKECFVIENAPYGIKAAKAAKMCCAAITTSLPASYLKEADIIFQNHKELYSFFTETK